MSRRCPDEFSVDAATHVDAQTTPIESEEQRNSLSQDEQDINETSTCVTPRRLPRICGSFRQASTKSSDATTRFSGSRSLWSRRMNVARRRTDHGPDNFGHALADIFRQPAPFDDAAVIGRVAAQALVDVIKENAVAFRPLAGSRLRSRAASIYWSTLPLRRGMASALPV
jgi:HEAT repeat protein